ncbi:hypothetical protein SELMODRAFT_423303 [Selaginella moellendorffii]|uniref:Uncharacterized protein n=1 Tax=Selaginella moellendorffii TaxID=88036 RepID=D8SL85_SELML|nr:hypothetical protein SELMODRAFT_423303 [Selaginella moellendorffii]
MLLAAMESKTCWLCSLLSTHRYRETRCWFGQIPFPSEWNQLIAADPKPVFHVQQHHHHHKDHFAKPPSLKSQQGKSRIWDAKDEAGNPEIPCSCCGRLKHWCNEKEDTICEIFQQPFKCYTAPIQSPAALIALYLMTT